MEEVNIPKLLIGVPLLRGDLISLGGLKNYQVSPLIQLISQIKSVDCLMGYDSGLGLYKCCGGKGELFQSQDNLLHCIRGCHQILWRGMI